MPAPELVDVKAGVVTHIIFGPGPDGRVLLGRRRIDALGEAIEALDPACRVVVIRSAAREFCGGLDLVEALALEERAVREAGTTFARCLSRMRRLSQAVVAVVSGPAVGGGVALAASADLVLSSSDATFQLPELVLGLTPSIVRATSGGRITDATLRRWALTGACIDAGAAREAGLVDQVASAAQTPRVLRALVKSLLRANPEAVALLKRQLTSDEGRDERLVEAADRMSTALADPALREALGQWLEGYAPPWFTGLAEGA